MNIAINKEINKQYIEAVYLYENEINSVDVPAIDTFINLAFLYWSFAAEEFEFNIPNNIPKEWSVTGGKKFLNLINLGLKKYPNNLELNFWKKYFPYRLFGESFNEDDCQDLINKYSDKESLVPYFFLYLFDKDKYKEQRDKLMTICNNLATAKNLYIKSIIS